MKKLALTSLLTVMAVGGAHAANIIDGNPLYRPGEGRFYSVTTLDTHSKAVDEVRLMEEFGYGITDRLAVVLGTTAGQADWFDTMSWDTLSVGVNYRVLDGAAWKADLVAGYTVAPVWADHEEFMPEETTAYTWTAGLRGGYAGEGFTIAGHALFDYANTESFNWNEDEFATHELRLGLDAQLLLNESWALLAGAEYTADLDNWEDDNGYWVAKFGANYNIDETRYVGAFITKEMSHVADGEWEVADGFGFGVNFGIEF